ncbi:MAG: hypothetical protein PWP65_1106 [Clostridia bacterium]|nr:hypothetical protein [Clostridia bacterium]
MTEKFYRPDSLQQFCSEVLQAAGVPKNEADLVSDSLIWANLRGVDSHGVSRLPVYISRIRNGLVSPVACFQILRETKTVTLIDGENSLGQIIALEAAKICMAKARETGVAVAGIKNTNHFGTAAYYTARMARGGYIGIALTNAPPAMAPWGGRRAMLGTNPISIAVPAGKYGVVILDMATSAVARGKIRLAATAGKPIPPDWAFDSEGRATTDPKKALEGSLFPVGGPKGYGLALMVDIFSGVLTGAAYADLITPMYLENPQGAQEKRNIGNFFCALDIGAFIPYEEFIARMEDLCSRIKNSPKAEGVEKIYLPGEIEEEKMQERRQKGIPIGETLLGKLLATARELGVETIPQEV